MQTQKNKTNTDNRIILENVSKTFKIGFKKNQSTLARFINLFSGKEPKKTLQALKNISFIAKKGEILGIIGKNGSGKSTLLRIIAGIHRQDSGGIKVNGKIVSLINLKVGLKDRLTMKDNIFLIGSFFRLTRKQIKQKFNSILEFAELHPFVNTKIYQFSEGMKARLAFSIAIHCNPDILLLDEVFEVGDGRFKIKSAEKIKDLVKENVTVLLVSHDLNMTRKYCERIIWLDKGKIKKKGATKETIEKYKNEI